MALKRFCGKCGEHMDVTAYPGGYDEGTGEQQFRARFSCPKGHGGYPDNSDWGPRRYGKSEIEEAGAEIDYAPSLWRKILLFLGLILACLVVAGVAMCLPL